MSKILRKTAKIFGINAGTNQIAEFGSFAAGSPAYTTDPAVIQTLSNYLSGWFSAIVGSNSPAIEDMNALCYLFAYQIAYCMQEGVPEYDSGTTYYIGSLCSSGGTLYVSLTNSNLGNAVTSGANWASPPLPGVNTPNAVPYSSGMTLESGSTMWPYMQIGSSQTVIVPSGSQLVGISNITLTGTGVLQATGTGVIRVL